MSRRPQTFPPQPGIGELPAAFTGTLLSGAGNRFVLVDARSERPPTGPDMLARKLCARPLKSHDFRPDGLLLLLPAQVGASVKLVVYNADGSRPAACGNGLRCVGEFLSSEGARGRVTVETDAGLRALDLDAGKPVRACLGIPRLVEPEIHLALTTHELRAAHVDVGNPHCVVLVEDERRAPVAAWGREIEGHRSFPQKVNVEFVALRAGRLFARVWERGVGETEACGTGACAIAAVLAPRLGLSFPVRVSMPGGELTVDRDTEKAFWVLGPVEVLGKISIPNATRG